MISPLLLAFFLSPFAERTDNIWTEYSYLVLVTIYFARSKFCPSEVAIWASPHTSGVPLRCQQWTVFAKPICRRAATIQAFVNGAIGMRLPSRDWWIKAYSGNTEMSTIRDLVTNPSKITNTTLKMVNYKYRAALHQSQIMIENDMLILREPYQMLNSGITLITERCC